MVSLVIYLSSWVVSDEEIPLILGSPFMKTVRIIIYVDEGKLKVRAQDDEVTFNLFNDLKSSWTSQIYLRNLYIITL